MGINIYALVYGFKKTTILFLKMKFDYLDLWLSRQLVWLFCVKNNSFFLSYQDYSLLSFLAYLPSWHKNSWYIEIT